MIRSFPPHPNPLPPGEREGHSSPRQSWGVVWHILINHNLNDGFKEGVMQVILLEDVPALGNAGDTVKVSDGYGRNYLIPRKKAILATEKGIKILEHQKREVQQRLGKLKKDAGKVGEQIENLSCTFVKTAGESGKLFGSVTSMEIESYLKENGIQVDRKKILLEEPIKNLGMFTIPIKLHPERTAYLKVWVVQE
jgi:large subunit ribosomal protein L9